MLLRNLALCSEHTEAFKTVGPEPELTKHGFADLRVKTHLDVEVKTDYIL